MIGTIYKKDTEARVLIKVLNHISKETALDILRIQIPSYSVEAELIGFFGIPQLQDTENTIRNCNETFLGYMFDSVLAGFISFTNTDTELGICRLVVHPDFFRKGIASHLVNHVLNEQTCNKKVTVSTGSANIPAKNLYTSFGFREVKEVEVVPGVCITVLERHL